MKRPLLIGSALLGLICASALGLRAAPPRDQAAKSVKMQLAKRLPKGSIKARRSTGPGTSNHIRTVGLAFDSVSLIDMDDDGESSVGDMALVSGIMVDEYDRRVGYWDGTMAFTSEEGTMVNITMLYPRRGTVTINGAPAIDGVRAGVPAIPVVGTTGRIPGAKADMGISYDVDADLLIVESGVR
jgi:hypothetical protein